MQQYLAVKEQHKDHVLFFRLGDFYEMFFDDAILASKELDLTLTGKECGLDERAPMCGIPYHAAEPYIQKLLKKGYKVAICEQTELPQKGKTLVDREVIRVVTPGTVLESGILDEEQHNYISSIASDNKVIEICVYDISTGSMQMTGIPEDDFEEALKSELYRYMPKEILVSRELMDLKWLSVYLRDTLKCSVEITDGSDYDQKSMDEAVKKQFADRNFSPLERKCLGQLLIYLSKTQKNGIDKISSFESYDTESYMQLSPVTVYNLELFETMRSKEKRGSLLWVLDRTRTSIGKRMIRSFLSSPLMDVDTINRRLDAVECMNRDLISRVNLQKLLSNIRDMERLTIRAGYGNASPRDLFALSKSIEVVPQIKECADSFDNELVKSLNNDIDTLSDLGEYLSRAIIDNPPALTRDGGFIKAGFDDVVDYNRHLVNDSMSILAEMEAKLKEETGIPKLKIGYNRVFGYYIEVTRSYLDMVPDTFIRKQTLAGAERFINEELKDLEQNILQASDKLLAREKALYVEILKAVSDRTDRILKTTKAISYLDVLASYSEVSISNNYVKPFVTDSDTIRIKDGRHPVIERMNRDDVFIPNDALLDCDLNRVNVITGPNMAGKSTFMRQVAIINIMAQIGCFVPAKSAEIGVCDAVYTRVGASDDLSSGRSTFMVEMSEVSEILKNATPRSLIILDEIGRGTSTFDGMSIARAVVEYIHDKSRGLGCKTLFATHYHELTEMESQMSGIVNYNIAVKKRGDDITFLRKIVRGGADDSYGIQVAKLAGIPDDVIERAKTILDDLVEMSNREKMAVRQLSFDDNFMPPPAKGDDISSSQREIIERLEKVDVNVLTPIEALNILNELKKMM